MFGGFACGVPLDCKARRNVDALWAGRPSSETAACACCPDYWWAGCEHAVLAGRPSVTSGLLPRCLAHPPCPRRMSTISSVRSSRKPTSGRRLSVGRSSGASSPSLGCAEFQRCSLDPPRDRTQAEARAPASAREFRRVVLGARPATQLGSPACENARSTAGG